MYRTGLLGLSARLRCSRRLLVALLGVDSGSLSPRISSTVIITLLIVDVLKSQMFRLFVGGCDGVQWRLVQFTVVER